MNVARMSGGQRQMVACARAIAFHSKILIMDEPTAALGVTEANKLLGLIRNLQEQGLSILLITQRIPDILAIADRVFVLKGGQRQDIMEVSQVTLDDVVTMIVKGKDTQSAGREYVLGRRTRVIQISIVSDEENAENRTGAACKNTPSCLS